MNQDSSFLPRRFMALWSPPPCGCAGFDLLAVGLDCADVDDEDDLVSMGGKTEGKGMRPAMQEQTSWSRARITSNCKIRYGSSDHNDVAIIYRQQGSGTATNRGQ